MIFRSLWLAGALGAALALSPGSALADDAAAEQERRDRLAMAALIDQPTAYYLSLQTRGLIEAVESSRFWKKPLVRRAVREISPEVAEAVRKGLSLTSREMGLWVPQSSVLPLARLASLFVDGGAFGLASALDQLPVLENNAARRTRLFETLEKGIVPSLVVFNRTDQAAALAGDLLREARGARTPAGLKTSERRTEAGEGLLMRLVPSEIPELARPESLDRLLAQTPLLRAFSPAEKARFKALLPRLQLVAYVGRVGGWFVVVVAPDTALLERLERNAGKPPVADSTLARSGATRFIREHLTRRTLLLTSAQDAGSLPALQAAVLPALADLRADLESHGKLARQPRARQGLARLGRWCAFLEDALRQGSGTAGTLESLVLVEQGLRVESRTAVPADRRSPAGGAALLDWLPEETLAFAIGPSGVEGQEEALRQIGEWTQEVKSAVDEALESKQIGEKEHRALLAGLKAARQLMEHSRQKLVPAVGHWSAWLATGSGSLHLPQQKLKLAIPELGAVVAVKDAESLKQWWGLGLEVARALLKEVAPEEKVRLPEPRSWSHRGVTIHGYDLAALAGSFEGDAVPNAAIVKGHVVLGTSLRLTRRMIDLAYGEGRTVRERPAYRTLATRVFKDLEFGERAFVDLRGWIDLAQKAVDPMLAREKAGQQSQDWSDGIFDLLRTLQALGTTQVERDGERRSSGWIVVSD